MNRSDFEDLNEMASALKDEFEEFDGEGMVNEYGEIEDDLETPEDNAFADTLNDVLSEDDFIDDTLKDTTPTTQDTSIAVRHTPTNTSSSTKGNSWAKRSYLAPNETDNEFQLFKLYCMNSGGRSLQYISTVSNITPSTLSKVSNKNNWRRRSEDYDRAELVKKMKQVQTSKHELHLRKLDKYREEQEALGQQLTLNAARIAYIANATLSKMLDSEQTLDARDLPGMLNVAAKLADVGKNLQSAALGVDNLLVALEEAEGG
jgi:hypothetical protein